MSNQNIFISTGEISGDLHGAELMKALSRIGEYSFYGLGGARMKALGLLGLEEDVSTLNTVGHVESLRFISRKLRHLKTALAIITGRSIKTLILVDNQGFNMILGKKAREMGLKVFYYIPPRVSVWGRWNAPKVAQVAHYILPFLASDVDIYQGLGAEVFYPGNPVMDKIAEFAAQADFLKKNKIPEGKTLVSLFPGSRYQEIRTLLPVFFNTAGILIKDHKMHILVSLAHEDFRHPIENIIRKKKLSENVTLIKDAPYDIMYHSAVNIMASGTATLESALLERWPLICYKISPISYAIAKKLVTKQMIGLPNILLDEKYYPELLQKELNPHRLVQEVRKQIEAGPEERQRHSHTYQRLKKICGNAGVAGRAAQYIQDKVNGTHPGN